MQQYAFDQNDLNLEEGWLCLDFANTLDWHASDHPEEEINSYADLLAWSRRVRLIDGDEAALLEAEVVRRPRDAEHARGQAIELREAIYQIFSATSHDREPDAQELATLNRYLSETMGKSKIVRRGDAFAWEWTADALSLDRMLGPIARSAAELLTSQEVHRVGECADEDGCGWLFLDTTRNHSRQWCSMESCGNRAKAKRHYQRQKAG